MPENVILETERLIGELLQAIERARTRGQSPDALPDPRLPCFGHLRVAQGNRRRDLLLGFCSLIDPELGVTLVDWRSAPLAGVFFEHEEGESYELEVEGRVVTGTLVHKRLLAFDAGELVRIEGRAQAYLRERGGPWTLAAVTPPHLSVSEHRSLPRHQIALDAAGRRIPIVGDLLDAEQRQLLERDPEKPLVILGGAGCGKTTVALHRLARLHQREPKRFEQKKMAVVVPDPGLQRLTSAILEQLGMADVGVHTFDDWVRKQARRVFPDLPKRECEEPPAAVVKVKRHPALRTVLAIAVDRIAHDVATRVRQRFPSGAPLPQELLERDGKPLLAWLERLERHIKKDRPARQHDDIRAFFALEQRKLHVARVDLLAIFGDRELMQLLASHSQGVITQRDLETTLTHTRRQFSDTAERTYRHVDEESRTAVDGLSLDQGTPEEVAETVDVEDYAVCFELLRLKTGGNSTPKGRPDSYVHLVLDEAQDLAPIELGVLGRALRPDGGLTVCGDQAQHIDPDAYFQGWEAALAEMGVHGARPEHLSTSYRCTTEVTRFAHEALGPLKPARMPEAVRSGSPVLRSLVATEAHAVYAITRALDSLLERESGVSVALICKTPESARRFQAALARTLPARLVLSGLFSFTPGIDVTPVGQVKGLEFDVVILPDVSVGSYADEADARRKLHVAATRAIEQLWVLSVGRPSPILDLMPPGV